MPLLQGGMKAVIWTDVFQVTVMFFSMLSVIIIVSTVYTIFLQLFLLTIMNNKILGIFIMKYDQSCHPDFSQFSAMNIYM